MSSGAYLCYKSLIGSFESSLKKKLRSSANMSILQLFYSPVLALVSAPILHVGWALINILYNVYKWLQRHNKIFHLAFQHVVISVNRVFLVIQCCTAMFYSYKTPAAIILRRHNCVTLLPHALQANCKKKIHVRRRNGNNSAHLQSILPIAELYFRPWCLRDASELVDVSSSAVSSSSSSFSVMPGSSASWSGSTHRPGMRKAESYELHSGPTMCVMNDSWSLASCGAARSMKGLIGRPRLDSSSPCVSRHQCNITTGRMKAKT